MRGVGAIFHIAPIRKQRAYVAYESKRWRNRSGSALARYSASPTRLVEGSTAIFVLIAKLYVRPRPPVGRARENRKFIQAPSPEIWSETISGGEEVLAGKWGGLFLGYLLGKIIGGAGREARPRSSRTAQVDGCSSLPCRGVL